MPPRSSARKSPDSVPFGTERTNDGSIRTDEVAAKNRETQKFDNKIPNKENITYNGNINKINSPTCFFGEAFVHGRF